MKPKLDLNQLEHLLESMEPGEIRARYEEELQKDPALERMLDLFEGMDQHLQRLKSADQPPAFQVPRRKPARQWLPWALPLAAALILAIFAGSRLLPFPEKSNAPEMAMSTEAALADEAGADAVGGLGRLDMQAPAEEVGAPAAASPEEPEPIMAQEGADKAEKKEDTKDFGTLGEVRPAFANKQIDTDDASDNINERQELVVEALEEARPSLEKGKRTRRVELQAQTPPAPQPGRASAATGQQVEEHDDFLVEPTLTHEESSVDSDMARGLAKKAASVPEKEREGADVAQMETDQTTDAPSLSQEMKLAELEDLETAYRADAAKPAGLDRRGNDAANRTQQWLDSFTQAWNRGEPGGIAALFSEHASVAWPLLGEADLQRDRFGANRRQLAANFRPPVHFEILSSNGREALVRWQILAQSSMPGDANQGGSVLLRFNADGLCEFVGEP